MQHNIEVNNVGPNGQIMADAVKSCVHCGFCLPACPTYRVLGQEMDSPRGRILLMKNVLEGTLSLNEANPFIEKCLGCMACVTACPPSVPYGDLLVSFREYANETNVKYSFFDKYLKKFMYAIMPYTARFRFVVYIGIILKSLRNFLPLKLKAMFDLLPASFPVNEKFPETVYAIGNKRARVALLQGCVQSVLAPRINQATIRVFARNGIEVIVPQGQGCCGALTYHAGLSDSSRNMALQNMKVFPKDVDAIITTAAGCGSAISEYSRLFQDTPQYEMAMDFSGIVEDAISFLDGLGIVDEVIVNEDREIAYHDACHLSHAQGIRNAPRRLLHHIPRLKIVDIMDGEICCGSAGIYNLEHPEVANKLGVQKAVNIIKTGVDYLVTSNIGCMTQIEVSLRAMNSNINVKHIMEILDDAYRGEF